VASELPKVAGNIAPEQMRGRFIYVNGLGQDYSYYQSVVRKVHFSFVINKPPSGARVNDYYAMFLPLAESAQWIHPGREVLAGGSSGSAVVDGETGEIVGVLSSVRIPPYGWGKERFFLGYWSNAQNVYSLLQEARWRRGFW